MKIEKINDENKIVATYNNLMVAAQEIETRTDAWKVAFTIAYAAKHNKKAYKHKWLIS